MMKCERGLALSVSLCLLAACGGRPGQATSACEAAIAERLSGQQYSVDSAAMAASAKEQDDDILLLQSGIVYQPGLPGEYKQTVDCKVRFGEGDPSVISLTFVY